MKIYVAAVDTLGKMEIQQDETQLYRFVKFSFPVTHLMPYYAKTGCSCPPSRVTLQITLMLQLFRRKEKGPFNLPSATSFLFSPSCKNSPPKRFACTDFEPCGKCLLGSLKWIIAIGLSKKNSTSLLRMLRSSNGAVLGFKSLAWLLPQQFFM